MFRKYEKTLILEYLRAAFAGILLAEYTHFLFARILEILTCPFYLPGRKYERRRVEIMLCHSCFFEYPLPGYIICHGIIRFF